MHNVEIALAFEQLADLLELAQENSFKIRAYRRAARIIAGLSEPVAQLLAEGSLTKIPGVGQAIVSKVEELLETNRLRALKDAAARFPPGLIQVMGLPGIGPKRARSLFDHLKVTNPADLATAAKAHKIRTVPGFGAKSEAAIAQNLTVLDKRTGIIGLSLARSLIEDLTTFVTHLPGVRRVTAAGSVRRWEELVEELSLLVETPHPTVLLDAITVNPLVTGVTGRDNDSLLATTRWGVTLRVTVAGSEETFWGALLWQTGPDTHLNRLSALAVQRSLQLGPLGLYRDNSLLTVGSEEDLYSALGLPFFPPELRGDGSEVSKALAGWQPQVFRPGAIRGDLHVHSRYSDGHNSLAELSAAAQDLGYEYLAVTDHSASLKIAFGLSIPELAAKNRAIDEANVTNQNIRLLKGTEVDILADGRLDYPDEVLAGLDVVVASVHTRFHQPAEEMTERVVSALKNEHVDILGHPTGRLLNSREPYALDLERVLEEAARYGTWLEVNSSPDRMDLSAAHIRLAAEYGVGIVINTDAHETNQLNNMAYGVALAGKAALDPAAVVNTLSTGELLRELGRKTKKSP